MCGGCGRVTGPDYSLDQCRPCWLRQYDPAWGGTKVDGSVYYSPDTINAYGRPVDAILLEIAACPHLGGVANRFNRAMEPCGAKVRDCAEFGLCTTRIPVGLVEKRRELSCCSTCPLRPKIQFLGGVS